MNDYIKQLESLNKMYNLINEKFFDNKLSKVIITLQKDSKAYGYFTIKKIWTLSDGTQQHEINISADYLQRDKYKLCGTLLHEMTHLYAEQNKIQDTSRQGRYHNKMFKQLAEKDGLLTIELADGIGWSSTYSTEKFKEFIDNSKIDFLNLYRASVEKLPKTAEKKQQYKFICPVCGLEIKTITATAQLLCVDCDEYLQMEFK